MWYSRNLTIIRSNPISDEVKYVAKLTSLFLLIAKLLSWKLWLTSRELPLVPISLFFYKVPAWCHAAMLIISICLMLLIIAFNCFNTLIINLLLGVEVLSCLLDQNRWQPWEYQYLFTFFIILMHQSTPKNLLAALLFIFSATYFYSGLSKLNEGFLRTTWDISILKVLFRLPTLISKHYIIHISGYMIGSIELLLGVGLVIKTTRKLAVIILIAMHAFILLLLGPFGINYNKIVWPWNIYMILCLYFLFYSSYQLSYQRFLKASNILVIIFWGILPVFNFFGKWDNYLSMSLYSGRTPFVKVCITDTANCKPLLRFSYKKRRKSICSNKLEIDVNNWAMKEIGVPVYPENRVLKQVETELQMQYPKAGLRFIYFKNSTDTVGQFINL